MIVNHTTSDEDLMQAYQNGNLLAFEILYARHKARIFGFLMKKLRNQFEAEEVFQSTFMKLHSSCQQYDPSFKFSPWLFTVCQSVLTDYLRKRNKRLVESNDDDFIDQIPAPQNNETESLPSLASLNENQRMALEMRYTEDLDFDEIAKKLQTSPANIRQLISRAIRKLRTNANQEDS